MVLTEIYYNEVAQAVSKGFAKIPKQLPSWLFYDKTGDKIFQDIMRMSEYYLTACEYEIIQTYKENLRKRFTADGSNFKLVEFGAGDGLKTEILLRHFLKNKTSFSYVPVDVSKDVLLSLVHRLGRRLPDLSVTPVHKRYDEAIIDFHHTYDKRKVFLFLGANIGNFSVSEATNFIKRISWIMWPGDQLLIGFDLKKNPRLIQAAYDDKHGLTREFNLNLLTRINKELGANFKKDRFEHYPFYDPESGTTKSFLVSLEDQEVYIEYIDQYVTLKKWEAIHTETSQKYDIDMINQMASKAGLRITDHFYDKKEYFCDVLFKK